MPERQDARASGAEIPMPDGFLVGHATRPRADTGCTVVLCPPGTRGAAELRGGGTGTRELEPLALLANAEGPNAVLFTGGSAFGLAAADGAMRWHEERGIGRLAPVGVIPLVPTAVIFDFTAARPGARPDAQDGYAACEAAVAGVPARGRIGAGAGAMVGKLLGRGSASPGGVGYAATRLAAGRTVAAVAVANAFGDVIAQDGSVLGGPQAAETGEPLRTAALATQLPERPRLAAEPGQSTTLACVCTDAPLDKRGCGIVARIASAGIARAVDPAFTPMDGDIVFCLASGDGPAPASGPDTTWLLMTLGTAAASVVAAAIRDGVPARRTSPRS